MNDQHPPIEDLFRVATEPHGRPDQDLIVHLSQCEDCREDVEMFREARAVMADKSFWESREAIDRAVENVYPELSRNLQQLDDEDAYCRPKIQAWFARGLGVVSDGLREDGRMASAGAVRALIEISSKERERHPESALSLIELGQSIASTLLPEGYFKNLVFQLRGMAEKERANVLRILGRHVESLEALDRAETWFKTGVAAAFDLAIVKYIRALVLFATDEPDRALALAIESAVTLLEFGDITRYAHSKMVEAEIRASRGEVELATQILEGLLPQLQEIEDFRTIASLSANLGNLAIDRRAFDAADTYFATAEQLFRQQGRPVELARTQWQFGVAQVHRGLFDNGIARLLSARLAFVSENMAGDVAGISLELVDSLVAAGRLAEAHDLCRRLPEECQRLGMEKNALLALAYIKECEAAGSLTPKATEAVRSFLVQARKDPSIRFVRAEAYPGN